MNGVIRQTQPEVAPESRVRRVKDEVNNLDRGVDDPERVGCLGQRLRKEPLVQLGDDLLLAVCVVDAFSAQPHICVEAIQRFAFFVERMLVEPVDDPLHRKRHRVGKREVVLLEQCLGKLGV